MFCGCPDCERVFGSRFGVLDVAEASCLDGLNPAIEPAKRGLTQTLSDLMQTLEDLFGAAGPLEPSNDTPRRAKNSPASSPSVRARSLASRERAPRSSRVSGVQIAVYTKLSTRNKVDGSPD